MGQALMSTHLLLIADHLDCKLGQLRCYCEYTSPGVMAHLVGSCQRDLSMHMSSAMVHSRWVATSSAIILTHQASSPCYLESLKKRASLWLTCEKCASAPIAE